MVKQFIALLFILLGFLVYGQDKMNFREFDSATFELYNEANWDALRKLGKTGLKQDIDYYYLRMRMGIADFMQEKYSSSIPHFEKALYFNSHDWTAKNYLYDSYIFSGKTNRANKYAGTLNDNERNKLGYKPKVISRVDGYAGYVFTNNLTKNGAIDLLGNDGIFSEQLLIGEQAYLHGGLGFNVSHSVSIYAGYSFLNTQKQNRYQYALDRYYVSSRTPFPGGGYQNNYAIREEIEEQSFNGKITQSELYLNARFQFNKGFSFNVFGNLLFIHLDQVDANLTTVIRKDTLAYIRFEDQYLFIEHLESDYNFIIGDTSFVNWVAGFNLQKDFNFLLADLSTSFSRLYSDNVFQLDLSITYFPFGSNKFYGKTGGIYLSESNQVFGQRNAFSFYQLLGVQLTKKLWLEGIFRSGNLRNMNINQGSVVYNLPEKVNHLAGIKVIIFANNHLSIDIEYDIGNKSGSYFTATEESDFPKQYFADYQTHSIIGGIKWIF